MRLRQDHQSIPLLSPGDENRIDLEWASERKENVSFKTPKITVDSMRIRL